MYTVSTADSSVGTTEYYTVQHRVEGYNFAHLNWGTSDAKPVTLSFWVKADVTGKYGISFWPNGQNYNYVTSYAINTADTWEYKTITIPGPTSGTWLTDNSVGCGIWWDFGTGTNYTTATTETWGQSNKFAPSDTLQMIKTNGAKFRMTGVQLEVGKNATEFEHRSYGEELALCQRYYFKLSNSRLVMGYKRHDSSANFPIEAPVPMRISPSPSLISGGIFTNFQASFGTTQTNPNVYEWNSVSGNRFILKVDTTWSSTHTYIPSWESFTVDFNSEL
jgi:hypothetical protein